MLEIKLTFNEKQDLEKEHTESRDGRKRDRIKALLLHSEGWTIAKISQALRIHPTSIGVIWKIMKKSINYPVVMVGWRVI